MKKTTLKCGITIPSKIILGYTGDGSAVSEKIRGEYFAYYEKPIERGLPIIETRLKQCKNPTDPRVTRYRQVFPCYNSLRGKLEHGISIDGMQFSWYSGSYFMYINDRDYKRACRAALKFIRQHQKEPEIM